MELALYRKIFDHIKSPVIITSPKELIDCNRAFLDLMKMSDPSEAQQYEALRQLVQDSQQETASTQIRSLQDMTGNTLLLELSVSSLSEEDNIHLLEFKAVDDRSLYDEITFISAHNRELFNNSPDAIVVLDSDGKVVDINDAFVRIFGFSRLETIGRYIDNLVVPPEQQEQAKALFQRVLNQERVEVTIQRQTKDKRLLDMHVIAYPVLIDKRITGNYLIYRDVTQAQKNVKLLNEKEEFLDQLFNRSLFPIAILDEDEMVLDINAKFEELFGYTRIEATGKNINDLVVPREFLKEATNFKSVIMESRTMMAKTKRRHKDGSLIDVEAVGSPVIIDGRVQGFFAMYRDIRVEEQALRNMKVLLNTDPLTGLYSRKYIYDLINELLKTKHKPFTLVYADLDQFKQVNDAYGHETGDHLLMAVARRLQTVLGEEAYVARIGGDEFLALIHTPSPLDEEHLMDRLHQTLSKPCDIGGHQLKTIASVGIAHYSIDGDNADELISAADSRMYEEKKMRRILRNPDRVDPVIPEILKKRRT